MKKLMLIAGAALCCTMMIGCGTTAAVTQAQPAQKRGTQLVDWQGSEFGKPVPAWVEYVSQQNYDKLSTLPEAQGKSLIAVEGYGYDRDVLQVWVETDRASGEMTNRIEQAVTREAGTAMTGNKDADAAKVKMAKAVTGVVSQSKFSGFQRLDTFWTQVQKVVDGTLEYPYYALYGIDEQLLSKQINSIMNQVVAETPEETAALADINRVVQASAMKSGAVSMEVR